ncbi:Fe(3+) ABC transporter substrate-binding protein [Ehrlichia ruminantium]|uniref:Fe(3+) ABC transporter substrate-binding protein n=1 Tax=Ehrlichia ruminantium TaxID=779 RepID=UPI0002DDA31B|nr:Fe(3+) ABC transporter substrate-binding protein [Ehrlichia ruminantium]KYW98853.1 Fe(3+) ABC transporter substrate-binding protein [Ehrlichia ruminantium]UOD98914.1 Fe(3+) ABC transporter substrate-binding protein [Ehrlichia ruminantium]
MKKLLGSIIIIVAVILGFNFLNRQDKDFKDSLQEVHVYSSRKEELLQDLFEKFTKETGIKVKYIIDEAAQLINRMENEGEATSADVFLTADAVNLILAKKKGLLQPIQSDVLTRAIPSKYRDHDGFWFGLTKRARVIVYNKNLVEDKELSTYEHLANRKWKDKILVRSSSSPYNQSLIAFMIANDGIENAKIWIRGLVDNMARKPSGGDTDQIYAVAAGEGSVAIVNSYYFGRIIASTKKRDQAIVEDIGIFFPNQETTGTMINISGGAVTKNAKNKLNAIKLLEFLSSKEAQKVYAQVNQEYPVVQGVELSEVLKSFGPFKESNLPLQELEKHLADSVKIADEEGWK